MTEWIQKKKYLLTTRDTHPSFNDRHCLRVKGWTKVPQSNETRKKVSTILIGQNSLQIKTYWRNKEHFIQLKSTVNQEDIFIQNIIVLNSGVSNFILKNLLLDLKTLTSINSR